VGAAALSDNTLTAWQAFTVAVPAPTLSAAAKGEIAADPLGVFRTLGRDLIENAKYRAGAALLVLRAD
jgi:hypothetical protein